MNPGELAIELEQMHPKSFAWALACCGHNPEEARDVLQTSYLKILDGRARFGRRASLQTWLFSVIRNTAASAQRQRAVRRRWLALWRQGHEPPRVEPPGNSCGEASGSLVREALHRLSPRQRQVLHLVFYQELSVRQAATVMGVTVGTARRHYERGKAALRQQLAGCEVAYA